MHARTNTHEYTLRCFEVEKASSSVPSLRNTNYTGHPCTVKHTKRDETRGEDRRREGRRGEERMMMKRSILI